jgi:hypothetical protein
MLKYDTHDTHDTHDADDAEFHTVPSEEEQAATSPHAGHADDLANSNGADGVIPADLNDGIGQTGHVTAGGPQPVYRSWMVPVALVIVANKVAAYACFEWNPPLAGFLLIPETVTLRAVVSEPIQRQQ